MLFRQPNPTVAKLGSYLGIDQCSRVADFLERWVDMPEFSFGETHCFPTMPSVISPDA